MATKKANDSEDENGSYCEVYCLKLSEDFRKHLTAKAKETRKNLRLGTYIKAILKKYTGYKEKELV